MSSVSPAAAAAHGAVGPAGYVKEAVAGVVGGLVAGKATEAFEADDGREDRDGTSVADGVRPAVAGAAGNFSLSGDVHDDRATSTTPVETGANATGAGDLHPAVADAAGNFARSGGTVIDGERDQNGVFHKYPASDNYQGHWEGQVWKWREGYTAPWNWDPPQPAPDDLPTDPTNLGRLHEGGKCWCGLTHPPHLSTDFDASVVHTCWCGKWHRYQGH